MNQNVSYGVLVAIDAEHVQVLVNQNLIDIPVDAVTKTAAESVIGEENAIVAVDLVNKQLLLEMDDSESQLEYLEGI